MRVRIDRGAAEIGGDRAFDVAVVDDLRAIDKLRALIAS